MNILIDGRVWLDKSKLNAQQLENIKSSLTIFPSKTSEFDTQDPPPIFMWKEKARTIGVPRGFYLQKRTASEHDEVLRVSDGESMGDFDSIMRFEHPFEEQATALKRMQEYTRNRQWGGWILKAGCGFGKTNVALEIAHRIGNRTLILVHKEFFLRQWRDRIEQFFPDAKIGIIRQNRCDYKGCDFVIGMLQSIAKDDGTKYPEEMYSSFGMIISDECHRIGAQTWADIIPRFSARWRMGLTATPRRKDDAENVFFHHIGDILYSAKSRPLVPAVRRLFTDAELQPVKRGSRTTYPDKLAHTQVVTQLTKDGFRTRQIADDVAKAVAKGRKVMVVSERLEHLERLHAELSSILVRMELPFEPEIDFYTGEWYSTGFNKSGKRKKKTRSEADLKKAERANVVLATKQMVEEGLDIPALDVLVMATPLSDCEQTVGRIRRHCVESSKCSHLCPWRAGECKVKPQPIVVDVIDRKVPQAARKWSKRASFYKKIGSL